MGINLVVAVTDDDWFEVLRHRPGLGDVNFWAPSAVNFHALHPGEMFLFKLHAPRNVIGGGGIFAHSNTLPCSLAWAAFGEANGARSAKEMRARIARYRKADPGDRSDFSIGCRILTQSLFFDEPDWIPVPASWTPNIVSFKTYNTGDAEGLALWEAVNDRCSRFAPPGSVKAAGTESRSWSALGLGKAPPESLSPTFIGGVARSRMSAHCRPWKRHISVPMARVANMRRGTACCGGATSTACSTPAM